MVPVYIDTKIRGRSKVLSGIVASTSIIPLMSSCLEVLQFILICRFSLLSDRKRSRNCSSVGHSVIFVSRNYDMRLCCVIIGGSSRVLYTQSLNTTYVSYPDHLWELRIRLF
jgi:hypothetical protein